MYMIRDYTLRDEGMVLEVNSIAHDIPSPAQLLINELTTGITWVATNDNGLVVGFLLSKLKELPCKLLIPYVYNVCVLPEYQGKGVASKLFKRFEEQYSDWDHFQLCVRHDNPAQKLYFDLGYRVISINKDFYGLSQDALVMEKCNKK